MAQSFETELAALQQQGASLLEAVKELNNPVYKAHAGDGVAGYWGEGETITAQVPVDGPKPLVKGRVRLPKGYKNDKWKSFGDFIRDGYTAHKSGSQGEFKSRHDSVFKAVQGMSVQEGQSAGYFVLPEFNQQIIERTYQNDIWSRTDQYTVNNNMIFLANAETSRATGSRHGGLRGYWLDEATALTKSKPTFRKIEINLKKLAVLVYLTEELIADGGPALEQYVARKAAEEFNFMLGDVVFNGSGVQQPLGILNSPALLAVTKETGQGAATIVNENIDKMWARRFVNGNYGWYHNQDCNPQLDNLAQDVGTGGTVLYRNADGIASAAPQTLKGAPRLETEFNATLGTLGDLVCADLSQYLTISKGGVNQAYSTHVEFLTDQVAVKFTMRCNGRPWETTPTTPFKGSNTQASFLALETRA